MLEQNHYKVMESIKDGATVWGYPDAMTIREIQKFDRELVTIIDLEKLKEITGEVFSAAERHPYFGAILTDKGVKALEEYKSQKLKWNHVSRLNDK